MIYKKGHKNMEKRYNQRSVGNRKMKTNNAKTRHTVMQLFYTKYFLTWFFMCDASALSGTIYLCEFFSSNFYGCYFYYNFHCFFYFFRFQSSFFFLVNSVCFFIPLIIINSIDKTLRLRREYMQNKKRNVTNNESHSKKEI